MKKFISGFLVSAILMCIYPVGAAIQQYNLHKTNMKVTVEGKEYKNTDYPILSYKAETYIPLGEVSKVLGIDSTIDLKKKTIDIKETADTVDSKSALKTTSTTESSTVTDKPQLPSGAEYVQFKNFNSIKYKEYIYISSKDLSNTYKLKISIQTMEKTITIISTPYKKSTIKMTENDYLKIGKNTFIKFDILKDIIN